jgi:catechol 2,3-dioxygenase-like lactoylglutathione lyase family enzyme
MGKIKGLHHLCVFTKDKQESLHFYRDQLGFEVVYQTIVNPGIEDLEYTLIRLGTCTIELLCPADPEKVPTERGIIDHIGLGVEDIEAVVASLTEKGVRFNMEIATNTTLMNGFKATTTTGPSGESVALYEFNPPYGI